MIVTGNAARVRMPWAPLDPPQSRQQRAWSATRRAQIGDAIAGDFAQQVGMLEHGEPLSEPDASRFVDRVEYAHSMQHDGGRGIG